MKIVVVYGEDEARARARYHQIIQGVKKKEWEVVSLTSKGNFSLAEKLTSTSLFSDRVLYTLENLNKLALSELKWLAKNSDNYEGSLLIFHKGNIPPATRAAFPKSAKYEKFEVPQVLFTFLDSFYPGNSKRALGLFEELLGKEAQELVVAMLARHLRDLYWVMEGASGMNIQSWRLGKLKSQANKFTKENLRDTIEELSNIDYQSKSGTKNTRFLLELLITEKLE
jgi:DNA polymerase III delta subunit